jgi:Mn2+/Fe2+ NRAMP family transporter
MFWPQVSNRVLLPFVLIFRLILVNNKELMGDYINPRTFNINSWVTVVIMLVLTRWMVVTSFFPS